jgi:hypothetical protein
MAIGFFTICFVVKAFLDYFMRRRLIEKGLVDKNVKHLFKYGSPALSSLKWGMVLIGLGGAVIIGRLVPYRWSDEITISSMFILAGLALVIYYFIAPKTANGNEDAGQPD